MLEWLRRREQQIPPSEFVASESITLDVHSIMVDRFQQLSESAKRRGWVSFTRVLDLVEKDFKDAPISISRILNLREGLDSLPLLHLMILKNASDDLIERVVRLGADFSQTVSGRIGDEKVDGLSAAHIAFSAQHFQQGLTLLALGHPPEVINGDGDTPLTLHLRTYVPCAQLSLDIIESRLINLIIANDGTLDQRNRFGKTALHYLVERGDYEPTAAVTKRISECVQVNNRCPYSKSELQELACLLVVSEKMSGFQKDALLLTLKEMSKFASSVPHKDISLLAEHVSKHCWDQIDAHGLDSWMMRMDLFDRLSAHSELFGPELLTMAVNTSNTKGVVERGLLHHAIIANEPLETIDSLLNLGANIDNEIACGIPLVDVQIRQSPLYVALQTGRLGHAEHLLKCGASLATLPDPPDSLLPLVAKSDISTPAFADRLLKCPIICEKIYGKQQILNWLDALADSLPAEKRIETLGLRASYYRDDGGMNFVARDISRELIEMVTARFSDPSKEQWSDAELVVNCAKQLFLREAVMLLRAGVEIPALYLNGKTADHFAPEELEAIRRSLIDDFNFVLNFVVDGTGRGISVPAEVMQKYFGPDVSGYRPQQSLFLTNLVGLDEPFQRLLEHDGNILDAVLLTKAWMALYHPELDPDGRAFAELHPKLMFRYPLSVGVSMAQLVEILSIQTKGARSIATELFALLMHPEITSQSDPSLGILTSSISSIPYLIRYNIEVTGKMVEAWRDLANISLGAKRYKYESKREYGVDDDGVKIVKSFSLLEKFGGVRVESIGRDHPFHSAYLFLGMEAKELYAPGETSDSRSQQSFADWILDPKLILVTSRAGVTLAHRDHGILFVRNSSLVFGRDLVPEPAYYRVAKPGENLMEAAVNLDPAQIVNEFMPILSPAIYLDQVRITHRRRRDSSAQTHIDRVVELIKCYQSFEEGFRRFKFDTDRESAWIKDSAGRDVLIGACNSPGFKWCVEKLRCEFEAERERAELFSEDFHPPNILEIHNKHYPPQSPYARLIVSEEVLQILEYLAENGWNGAPSDDDERFDSELPEQADESENPYREFGVYQFFQMALLNQAELVIVSNGEN